MADFGTTRRNTFQNNLDCCLAAAAGTQVKSQLGLFEKPEKKVARDKGYKRIAGFKIPEAMLDVSSLILRPSTLRNYVVLKEGWVGLDHQ